jgi:MerR family transcriptional regulator, mercuric resistance operon regulatory protein
MTPIDKNYFRGQLAEATGVKGETIRYYEKCGLLQTPARNAAGYRIYSENHMKRLIFIRRCREIGFSLSEIDGLIDLGKDERSCEQVRELTATHLADVQGKIKDLKKMEQTLKSMIRQCDTNAVPDCPIIDVLSS